MTGNTSSESPRNPSSERLTTVYSICRTNTKGSPYKLGIASTRLPKLSPTSSSYSMAIGYVTVLSLLHTAMPGIVQPICIGDSSTLGTTGDTVYSRIGVTRKHRTTVITFFRKTSGKSFFKRGIFQKGFLTPLKHFSKGYLLVFCKTVPFCKTK